MKFKQISKSISFDTQCPKIDKNPQMETVIALFGLLAFFSFLLISLGGGYMIFARLSMNNAPQAHPHGPLFGFDPRQVPFPLPIVGEIVHETDNGLNLRELNRSILRLSDQINSLMNQRTAPISTSSTTHVSAPINATTTSTPISITSNSSTPLSNNVTL